MSAKVMGMVFDAGPAEATQRFVLLAIADNCDDGGFAYPGVDLLAQKSCQTERNVLRILQALEVGGWLTIKRRSWGAKKRGNTYQLNMMRLRRSAGTSPNKAVDSPDDKLSPDTTQSHDSIEPVQPPHDKLSPDVQKEKTQPRGDKQAAHEVTNSSSRGDISRSPFNVFNRQEPSTEPNTTPIAPKGACEEAVAKVMRELDISNPRMHRVIARAIEACRAKTDAPPNCNAVAESMIAQRGRYLEIAHLLKYQVGIRKFFGEGIWADDRMWEADKQGLTHGRMSAEAMVGVYRE